MNRWLGMIGIAISVLLQGCRTPYRVPDWPEVPELVRSRIQAMSEQYRWTSQSVEVSEPEFNGANWRFTVVRLPKTPGGFTTYDISSAGGVVRAVGGY
jgi:hypothetical protein